jgi:hypothetical protein
MKTCSRCKVEKPLEEFSMDGKWHKSKCKECVREIWHLEYQHHREMKREREENKKFSEMIRAWMQVNRRLMMPPAGSCTNEHDTGPTQVASF